MAIAKSPESEGIGLLVDGLDLHGSCATSKPAFMSIEVSPHGLKVGTHLHAIAKLTAIAADLTAFATAQCVG